jgi:hypothetical protein
LSWHNDIKGKMVDFFTTIQKTAFWLPFQFFLIRLSLVNWTQLQDKPYPHQTQE